MDGNPYLRTASGQQINLMPNRVYVIGRDETCDLRVDDQACSRRHARISVFGDGRTVHIEDMGSKNGTVCNDHPLDSRCQLADGDVLRCGSTTYSVHIPRGAAEIHLDTRTNVDRS